jgi:hypothetical protein
VPVAPVGPIEITLPKQDSATLHQTGLKRVRLNWHCIIGRDPTRQEARLELDLAPQLIPYIQTKTAIVTSTTAPYAMRAIRSTAMARPW